MSSKTRKFYKLFSLHTAFSCETIDEKYTYNVSEFNNDFATYYNGLIDEHTILFITADDADDDRYITVIVNDEQIYRKVHAGDTFIWVHGDLYAHSGKCVEDITFDNQIITVTYQDGGKLLIPIGDTDDWAFIGNQ